MKLPRPKIRTLMLFTVAIALACAVGRHTTIESYPGYHYFLKRSCTEVWLGPWLKIEVFVVVSNQSEHFWGNASTSITVPRRKPNGLTGMP